MLTDYQAMIKETSLQKRSCSIVYICVDAQSDNCNTSETSHLEKSLKRELVGGKEMTERKAWHVDQVQVMSAFKRLTLMCSGGIQRLKEKQPQKQVAG